MAELDSTVLYKLSYGLYIVGAFKDGRPVGCTINTCFQVTSQTPQLLVVSLNKNNFTLEAIREFKRFSLSILSEDSDPSVIGTFGFSSSRTVDKYADYGYDVLAATPCVKGQFAGRLALEAEQFVDCGTHVLVIGRLIAAEQGSGTPMTYAYYHNVIKGKAPKNAPTYRADEDPAETPQAGKRRFRCDVCGFEVEFDGEIPADYVCPLCRADASHFKEIN